MYANRLAETRGGVIMISVCMALLAVSQEAPAVPASPLSICPTVSSVHLENAWICLRCGGLLPGSRREGTGPSLGFHCARDAGRRLEESGFRSERIVRFMASGDEGGRGQAWVEGIVWGLKSDRSAFRQKI